MDYLLEALKRRELYSGLHFAPVKFWHTLLFRDRYNYLGLKAPLDPSIQQQISQHPGSLSQVPTCCMHNSFLPKSISAIGIITILNIKAVTIMAPTQKDLLY